jgi:hypothetical protein
MAIEDLIVEASSNPLDPVHNFNIAVGYEKLGQTAAAVSFFLRAAEYGYETHPLIVYNSLLKVSICMDLQKDRTHTAMNNILQAISYMPYRPEGYFMLSRAHERAGNWQECYTFADIGLQFTGRFEPLLSDVDYPGLYGLLFEKAVSGWWVGRRDESQKLLEQLINDPLVNEQYKSVIRGNLDYLDKSL